MGQIWNKEFIGGLDSRRMPECAAGGTLIEAVDGHITNGGEFEQRAAFVEVAELPLETVGLAAGSAGLVTFGSAEPPEMPAGYAYQQLQSPTSEEVELIRVPSTDLYAGTMYAVGQFADGSTHHFYDGVAVEDWYDGKARASFRVTAGASGSELTTLAVDGISIIAGGGVDWTTSHFATAQAIASAINSHTSSPNYTATAFEDQVTIIAPAGVAANGRTVAYTVGGTLALSPASGFALAGGSDEETFTPGNFVRTVGAKMYALSGSAMHFSGIQQPTQWTTDAVGAGFIDMSTHAAGSEQLQAVAKYQNLLAIFAKKNIQIWYVDPDPTLNKQSQVLNNTGTSSPRSVTQFGDNDLYYLAKSGLRSLRARDSSNAAATADIGIPVDTLVTDLIATLSIDDRTNRVFGLIEPVGGRFWLIILNKVFVFSYFPGSKVSAWTMYQLEFDVDDVAVFDDRVYLRSTNKVYVYGGLEETLSYEDVPGARARAPFLDGGDPTLRKTLSGMDIAAIGEWEVWMAADPKNQAAMDKIGVCDRTTYNHDKVGAEMASTHFSPLFIAKGGQYARLGAFVIHFDADENTQG